MIPCLQFSHQMLYSVRIKLFPAEHNSATKWLLCLCEPRYTFSRIDWHTLIAEAAAVSTTRETRKNPLPHSPPGNENRMSMFLRKVIQEVKNLEKYKTKTLKRKEFNKNIDIFVEYLLVFKSFYLSYIFKIILWDQYGRVYFIHYVVPSSRVRSIV